LQETNREIYEKRIKIISDYFNVSSDCAVFMYYRRKRGYPWKRSTDIKYLHWNIQLQNALIKLDMIIDFNWKLLEFGNEYEELERHGIDIYNQPKYVIETNPRRDIENTTWQYNISKKRKQQQRREIKQILKSIGLL